ncbi:MAG TPA: molecular chaperone HtpG [Tepidisphaeraceae bacterium]|jgi:molecular chaperone HtpG|nr:molecular chaperone HtpG [Tepidisphaeraceae bacterium]
MTATATPAAPQRMEFKTELKQLLDLIIHSLYTKKEIFLRELISNAADAIDKIRFESLKEPDLLEGNSDFKIQIIPDEKAGTLTIRDNGVGMSRASIVENLGTIARSGTKQFIENLKAANVQNRPELIGQFGVGFYASFMVADRVTVLSRHAGDKADGVRWESDGQGEYTVEQADKETRGTDIVLHLRDDAKEFLSGWTLKDIVKRYSDFIDHPIVLITQEKTKEGDEEKSETKEEVCNSRQAIWLRPKNEVKPEEYNAFYKQLAHDMDDPLKVIHVAAEGTTEFRALMFIPAHRGMDFLSGPEKKSGLDLYVRRVLISHECEELSPPWMRFVKGVVDSADLPLNVSRETLQHNPLLAKIKSNVVNRVIKTLDEIKTSEYETYVKFFREFGSYIKEGAATDWSNRDRLADLLLVESTKTEAGKYTTLADYVSRMSSDQKEIFYLIGESRDMIANSPYIESFRAKGQEVLLLTDPVDEYMVQSMPAYKDKRLKPADRGDVEDEKTDEKKAQAERFKPLLEALKSKLTEVHEVRLSSRLKESAAVLVSEEHAMGAHMERLFRKMGRGEEIPKSERSLELNPEHPAVQAMLKVAEKDANDARVEELGRLFYDQALIAEGSQVKDPVAFARRINDLIALRAAQDR